jgi:glutaconate CoA-transferase subunit B
VLIIMQQSARAFVRQLDFVTSVGFLDGGDARERAGLPGKGPAAVITDLCILEPDPVTRELTVVAMHPGVARAKLEASTGWPIRYAARVSTSEPPSTLELATLRNLVQRTALAHGPD